jgi:hypothetical protein
VKKIHVVEPSSFDGIQPIFQYERTGQYRGRPTIQAGCAYRDSKETPRLVATWKKRNTVF